MRGLALREDEQRLAGLLAVEAGALDRLFDGVMADHERKRFVEIRCPRWRRPERVRCQKARSAAPPLR